MPNSTILAISSIYSIAISTLFQAGYWWTFGVNPFEYISLSDVVALSLVPLLLSVGSILLAGAFTGVIPIPVVDASGAPLRFSSKWQQYWFLLLLAPTLFKGPFISRASTGALLFTFFFSHRVRDLPATEALIPNYRARHSLVFTSFMVFLLAAPYGWDTAHQIKAGTRGFVVDKSVLMHSGVPSHAKRNLRYLGVLRDYLFLSGNDDSLIIKKLDSQSALHLTPQDLKSSAVAAPGEQSASPIAAGRAAPQGAATPAGCKPADASGG